MPQILSASAALLLLEYSDEYPLTFRRPIEGEHLLTTNVGTVVPLSSSFFR